MIRLLLLLFVILCSCKTTTYYISRHAEKAGAMTADPPLTAEGEKQALELRNYITGKGINAVYSTNFIRTKATATPTADANNLAVNIYNPAQGNALVDSLKAGNKKNVLIIGHSNTVDDLVNRFLGTQTVTDLPETEYGSLFIVQKRRSGYSYRKVSVLRTEGR